MSRKYTPRRSGARWREGAPDYVLDCFDHPAFADRYTVFFTLLEETNGRKWLHYLGIGDYASGSSDMEAHEVAAYRYANKHRRCRWLDIPEHIRNRIVKWWEND